MAAIPNAIRPGDVLLVREDFDAPTGRGQWGGAPKVRLSKGQRVEVEDVSDTGLLLLRRFWPFFRPERFERP